MQAIDAHLPGIYENGGGLYFPRTYRFAEHPAITPAMRRALGEVRRALQREVVDAGLGYFQPGKEVSLSLYPLDGISVPQLHRAVAQALAGAQTGYVATASVSCVDVLPQGIDKGAGVRWLADVVGVPLARIGGIGDSTSDLAFLSIVGFAAAPANATDEVRAAVDYVSLYEEGEGVVDILHRWQGAP